MINVILKDIVRLQDTREGVSMRHSLRSKVAKVMRKSLSKKMLGLIKVWHFHITLYFRKIINWGLKHHCLCCDSHIRFFKNRQCPICMSSSYHRYLFYFLRRDSTLKKKLKVFETSPMVFFHKYFSTLSGWKYISADIKAPNVTYHLDYNKPLPFPDDSFDLILCSHVLEHVEKDQEFMTELRRILNNKGKAFFLVPLDYNCEATIEDKNAIVHNQGKGLHNRGMHWRLYGRDIVDAFRSAGFDVKVEKCSDIFSDRDILRYGLNKADILFLCEKEKGGSDN